MTEAYFSHLTQSKYVSYYYYVTNLSSVVVFVLAPYMYLYLCYILSVFVNALYYICICFCPGGPKGPHLVAEGHQPSTGARIKAGAGMGTRVAAGVVAAATAQKELTQILIHI